VLLRAVIAALSLAACLQIANLTFAPARGLQAEYFTGDPGGTPALTGVDAAASTDEIQRRWLGSAPTNFSVRWYGFLTIAQPGRYTFSVSSDDGALLTLDGSLAIDNGGRVYVISSGATGSSRSAESLRLTSRSGATFSR